MSKYLLSHKQLDLEVIAWEKLHAKNKNQESLYAWIRNKQALWMAEKLLEDGISSKNLKQLKKELSLDNSHQIK